MFPEIEEEEVLTTPLLPWLTALVSLVLGLLWVRPLSMPTTSGIILVGPMLAYLAAEVFSPSLPGFGRYPLSAAAWLSLVGCNSSGPLAWVLMLAAGFLIRGIRGRMRGDRWLSVVGDSLPELWSGVAGSMPPAPYDLLVATLVYWGGWQLLPGLFASAVPPQRLSDWSLARERGSLSLVFLSVIGGAVAWQFATLPETSLVILVGIPLLSVAVSSQIRILEAESQARRQERVEKAQERVSSRIAELQNQVDLQRVDVELQHRVLTLVGELFMESALVQSAADLRPALLSFIRRAVPGSRITLFEWEGAELKPSSGIGSEHHLPTAEALQDLSASKVRAQLVKERTCSHLAAVIPQRGLLVVSDPEPRWQPEHHHLLHRLAYHLPLCLDAVHYREFQSRILEDEQSRRAELHRLAARLTSCLDLLGQLVSCRSIAELGKTAQNRLPDLIPGYQVEVLWHEQHFSAGSEEQNASYSFALDAGGGQEGRLSLYSRGGGPLSVLDRELLNLFSIQFACLLEGADLNARLLKALEQVRTSQAQLVQSSKMAAIGQLAAGVAHELNTPLGAVSIAVELSIETLSDNPAGAAKRLKKAMESIEQMQGIISKLLFYSRDSRGLRSQVDLYKVMDDSYQLVAHTLKMTGVEVEVKAGPAVVIEANSNELQQVFSNLLINAKDACQSEGATQKRIEMWLETQNQHALVHVRDYGCGMDEETRQRIFEPFYTTKAIGQGTGLGLSTSLELIQQHGGTLSCQSQPGQGTHFIVSLPLKG